jgi:cystathionine gamma-lyase
MSEPGKPSQRSGHDPRLPHYGTRVVRAGLPEPEQGEPFLPGPVFAAPFHVTGDPHAAPAAYTRHGNPTWARYEQAVGGLEDAEAVLFSSGMAAAAALLLTHLAPGSVLALDAGCYHAVRGLAATHLEPRGVEVRLAPPPELAEAARGADMLWLETPSNPTLEVHDIAALAGGEAIMVVDNTTAGPLLQQPLDLGADFVLTSATKQMSGHADLILGYVTTRDAERAQSLRDWRRDAGAIAGPFETWLAHRSLATLALRLERACDNAMALARLLAARDDVDGVRYPGLPDDPGHELARRQMDGYAMVVSFDLGSAERAERFLSAAQLVTDATSFGSVHTSAERRARWGGDDVPEGFIRLSAGCEDTADLLADVEHALSA